MALSNPSLPLSLGQGSRENTLRVEPPKERGQPGGRTLRAQALCEHEHSASTSRQADRGSGG